MLRRAFRIFDQEGKGYIAIGERRSSGPKGRCPATRCRCPATLCMAPDAC